MSVVRADALPLQLSGGVGKGGWPELLVFRAEDQR